MTKRVHVLDDFQLLESFVDKKGNSTEYPACNWRINYYCTPYIKYSASYIDGVFTNCTPIDKSNVLVLFNNHKLGVGKLRRIFEYDIDNELFADGEQNISVKSDTNIELIDGNTDTSAHTLESLVELNEELIAPIIRGKDGDAPEIGKNGNWWIAGNDTGVRAEGTTIKEYNSHLQFPTLGIAKQIYLDKSTNKMYRWDGDKMGYHIVGSNYLNITIVNGGGATK